MSTTHLSRPPATTPGDTSFFGHPKMLASLFSVEMWERFSFYGMQGILLYYMYFTAAEGGLGIEQGLAAGLVGAYGGGVYLSTILGAWLADRLFGSEKVLFGSAILIMAGHIGPRLRAGHSRPDRRPGAGRRRIRRPEGQRHRPGGKPLPGEGRTPRRRILHLLHGHQRRRADRPAGHRLAAGKPGVPLGLRRRRRRHGRRTGHLRAGPQEPARVGAPGAQPASRRRAHASTACASAPSPP